VQAPTGDYLFDQATWDWADMYHAGKEGREEGKEGGREGKL
jgi:hypothetical protein